MKKTALYVVTLIVLVVLLGAFVALTPGSKAPVHAQTANCISGETSCLAGWAWSQNVGWISFNSTDAGAGGGPYDVSIDTSGNLGGYAWSQNVGWISFNPADLSAAPACSGATVANVNRSSGSVTGWARAMSAVGSANWNGCIELSDGSKHPTVTGLSGNATSSQGVSYNATSGILSGYAWGDLNLGWIQFSPYTNPGGGSVCISGSPCNGGGTTLNSSCTASPSSATVPTDVTLTLTTSNGTGPYRYANGTPTSGPYTLTLHNQAGPIPPIAVTDSAGNTGTAQCAFSYNPTTNLTCSLPAHATWCAIDGSGNPVPNAPNTGSANGVTSSSACSAAPTYCEFYCQSGYKLNAAKTACISASLQEF
jgi:hypothetical protein